MEQKIILTPRKVAKILNIELNEAIRYCLFVNPGFDDAKIKKLADEDFELSDKIKIINQLAIGDYQNKCLLHETMHQINTYLPQFLQRILSDNKSVENISFEGQFKFYDLLLTTDNRIKVYQALSRRHMLKYGSNTKQYKHFELINTTTVTV